MIKRKSLVLLITSIILLVCVSSINAETVELEFWTFVDSHAEYYEMKAKEFSELDNDMEVILKASVYPFDEMHNKLNMALQTGIGVPDLVDIEIGKVGAILSREDTGLIDLAPMLEEYRDKIVEARLTPYSRGEEVYGIPTHIGTGVIFYNKALFDEAGVSVDDIETWDDYVEVGKKLTKDTNGDGEIDQWMSPVCRNTGWPFHMMARQFGSDVFDKDGNLILDRPENATVLKFMQDLVYEHEIGNIVGHYEEPTFYDAMNKGAYASLLPMPQWHMSRFTRFLPDLEGDIVVRPIPAWPSGGTRSSMGGGTCTSVTKEADNIEIAQSFLEYAKLTKQAGIDIWTKLGFDPIIKSAYEAPELNQNMPYFANENVLQTISELQSDIQPLYLTEDYPITQDVLTDLVFNAVEENQDVEKLLEEAVERIKTQTQ